jgi:endonuclease YncB( thermonuclease family)
MGEPGSGDGSLKDQQLMAERKVLQGDRRRLDEQGAKEGPETNHEDHRGPPHQAWHLRRQSTGAGVAMVREVQAGRADGLLDRDRLPPRASRAPLPRHRCDEHLGRGVPGQGHRLADGDTITVLHERRPEIIRLNGIDAPEKGQAFGERAKQFTAQLSFGQVVEVIVRNQDRYGRTVADVRLPDGRSLNHEVVSSGYAWWFRRYSRDASLAALESEARTAQRGLWADAHPIAP